jgi:thioredoxin 1
MSTLSSAAYQPGANLQSTDVAHYPQDVLNNPLPVLLDFWGPACAHCLSLMPAIEKIAAQYAGRLAVFKIQSRENWRVAVQIKVSTLPTLVLFKGGQEIERLSGEIKPQEIEQAVRRLVDKQE